jgi:hypothetical protein
VEGVQVGAESVDAAEFISCAGAFELGFGEEAEGGGGGSEVGLAEERDDDDARGGDEDTDQEPGEGARVEGAEPVHSAASSLVRQNW